MQTSEQTERRAAHKAKMQRKAVERQLWYERNGNQPLPSVTFKTRFDQFGRAYEACRRLNFPASINRHTGESHEHQREIARRQAEAHGSATP